MADNDVVAGVWRSVVSLSLPRRPAINATTITVTTPAGTAGEAAVVVLHENGNSEPGTFTYVTPPATPTGGDKGSRGLAVTGGDLSGMGLLALLALIPMLAGGVLLRRGRRTAS